jgi:hypothetical protein
MSPIGNPTRNSRADRRGGNAAAEERGLVAELSRANTPYWLLWLTGTVAFVLCIVAFVLWGVNGASTLFDMMVALCT